MVNLKILNDDGTITNHTINKEVTNHKNDIQIINSSSKEQNALKIIDGYYSNKKSILYDDTNKDIKKELEDLSLFENHDFSMMFFTSGSTGKPIGALKTKSNLEEEVKVFTKLVQEYNIKQVIVTVPFVHIYGTLVALLYPLLNDIDIVLKEHFLPFNLLEAIEPNSLIVTTPLYIKALNKVSDTVDLSSSLFVSSTAPLDPLSAKEFSEKFNTDVMQLFGSTETSGIAYKKNDEQLWSPLDKVDISVNSEDELKVSSPFVSNTLYNNGFKDIEGSFQTFDFIEQYENKFKLVGRSSKIFKLAGKRYSTVQVENILEDIDEIQKALVFVKNSDDNIRDEILDITLQSKKEFSSLEIKKILKSKLSNLKFSIKLHYVDEISTNAIGKKLLI